MSQAEERASLSPFSQLPDGACVVVQHDELRSWGLVKCFASEQEAGGDWVSLDHARRTKVQQAAG